MINADYLNMLPEIANAYDVELEDGEKVVFIAEMSTFGTEKDRVLGSAGSKFTLTNKKIVANNNVGSFTVDVLTDITRCAKVESGKFIFKSVHYAIDLNKEVVFDNGQQTLSGYHFYFNKDDTIRFDEITRNLFG